MNHARISGWLLLFTAALHSVTGVVRGLDEFRSMWRDGLWMSAAASTERQLAIWFLIGGFAFILSGILALGCERPLPSAFGWTLLALGIGGVVLFGASGFVIVVPQALYILIVAYRRCAPAG